MDDLRLLEIDVATRFVISPAGRIECERAPDETPGPRTCFIGCKAGNIVRVRHDVGEPTASRIHAFAARAPAWDDAEVLPSCAEEVTGLLSLESPVASVVPGIIFHLPNGHSHPQALRIVHGDSAEGEVMLARLAKEGMPRPLHDAGFVGPEHFWPPWCVAVKDGEIASMAFAARMGEAGAEAGVYTLAPFRGLGLAAAVTASWSSMAALEGRSLFYSTQMSNHASRRVAARLGLRPIGASLSIT